MTIMLSTNPTLNYFFSKRANENIFTVDMGNTNPHVASFHDGELKKIYRLSNSEELEQLSKPYVVSSVTDKKESTFRELWNENVFCNMPVHYEKSQLGLDRLYQSAFLYHVFSQESIVLVDSGTFITVDLINKNGFCGGHIYPGPQTFLDSYTRGERLPTVKYVNARTEARDNKLPSSTEEAMRGASHRYLKNLCDSIEKDFNQSLIILTGGYGELLKDYFKSAQVIPHLIHYSLYYLYQESQRR